MKVRYIFRSTIATLVAVTMLTACGDFVDILPKDLVTEDNYWNEKNDVEQFVSGIYAAMQSDEFISRCVVWGEGRSDHLMAGKNIESGDSHLYELLRENILSTNFYTRWDAFYNVINKCNIVISRAQEVSEKDPSFTSGDVKATIAEVTALRSLCYFYLIRAFKDVPFTRDPVTEEKQYTNLAATSFDEVLSNLISDLEAVKDDAMSRYPSDNDKTFNSNCNRITRNAINAMLADMYLWSGDYQKCVDACQAVIDDKIKEYDNTYSHSISTLDPQLIKHPQDLGNGYPLYLDGSAQLGSYGYAFNAIFGTGNSFESIFELCFNNDGGNYNNYAVNTALGRLYGEYKGSSSNGGAGYFAIPQDIVTDILNASVFLISKDDARYFENMVPDNTYNNATVAKGVNTRITITYDNTASPVPYRRSIGVNTLQNRNWIFYRLTDVMLMQAEAYACLASTANSDADKELYKKAFFLIYPIENRSYMGPLNNAADMTTFFNFSSYASKSATEKLVQAARQRELMFEGKRWFDLVRLARRSGSMSSIHAAATSKQDGSGAGLVSSQESMYLPYSKYELKRNTNLKQKEYYASEAGDEYEKSL